ncbi:MAG: hypothetical protein KQH63_11315 [Desulfobulbaceae bacterium]|nr:hypothetical protein [Desulfobulbaceae bacterium]
MEKKKDVKKISALVDALNIEMVVNQALIDLLVDKGILSHDEIQAKIKEIKVREGIVLSSDASNKASN